MRQLTVALIVTAGLLAAQPAHAYPIVYTGPGTGPDAWELSEFQWLAGEFSVLQAWTITDVQGWIDPDPNFPGSIRFRLYSDGGDVPGVPLPGLEQSFTINGPSAPGWYGPSGLSWHIEPGSYWLAFEVPVSGFNGGMSYPSPNPLINEAYNASGGLFPYIPFDDLNIGVRVCANHDDCLTTSGTSVPDTTPTALLFLLGTGLIAAATRRRRQTA